MVGAYSYTALPTPGHIRLLTLKASKSKSDDLHGELIDYPLQECEGDLHCYEALSYVWGDGKKPRHIWIGTSKLHITENLYTALMRLRNHSADRSLWVDAICINQTDDAEKSIQVQRMANVYNKASRVRVWLGESANGSDEALDCLANTGAAGSYHKLSNKSVERIRELLGRDWFKRIWVLQEVAAAQHVVIMCGATSIDGFAFCVGLQALDKSGKLPDLQSYIGSIVYLIRRSIFRPRKQNRRLPQDASTTWSLDIQPLGQLIDMYRNRQATDQRDKVYALLGMRSDDIPYDLLPDYSDAITWDRLLGNLARYIFGAEANIEIVATDIVAVRTRGKIMGHISSVRPDEHRYDMQVLTAITSWDANKHAYNESIWTIPTSAVPVQRDDIMCLLEGSQNIAILRPETEFFRVITTSGSWLMGPQPYDQEPEKPNEYELLLSWDWTAQKDKLPSIIESVSTESTLTKNMDDIARLQISADIFLSACLDKKAELSLLKLERSYQERSSGTVLAKLGCSAEIVYICLKGRRWAEAEKRFQYVYQHARETMETKWLSESITQYLRLFPIIDPGRIEIWETLKAALDENPETLEFYVDIHKRLAHVFALTDLANAQILLDLGEILSHSQEMAELLPTGAEDLMMFTKSRVTAAEEHVVVAAAVNGRTAMALLFEKRGNHVEVTEKVVMAAAGNDTHGPGVMQLLFEKRADQVLITENVVMEAAKNWCVDDAAISGGSEAVKLLLLEKLKRHLARSAPKATKQMPMELMVQMVEQRKIDHKNRLMELRL
ncbi:hypothetical protein E8E14_002243 [Neopestalotiopsis sp. 37M]|nr:hypothetical protein E8E14_002243 [Neopestalotiopsis sp. 37M]